MQFLRVRAGRERRREWGTNETWEKVADVAMKLRRLVINVHQPLMVMMVR